MIQGSADRLSVSIGSSQKITYDSWRWIALPIALLIVLVSAVYWPGLSGSFLFDDYPNIVNNKAIQIDQLDLTSLQGSAKAYKGFPGRPIATISFAIDYYFHGKDPWGYKFSNLMVHLLNTILVFFLTKFLLQKINGKSRKQLAIAFLIALAWATHPIQISTTLYIVQRMEMLSLTFVLLALLSYLTGRARQIAGKNGWPWIAATVPLGVLGLLSKETAALLPLYALCIEFIILNFDAAAPRTRTFWKWTYGLTVIAAIAYLIAVSPQFNDPAMFAHRNFTLSQRLLTQLRVLPMYLGQALLPLPTSLPFYYDNLQISRSLWNPMSTLLGMALITALLATATVLRKSMPLISLGIIWFFAAHTLTSSIIPLELAFEHRNYFALLGVLLAVAELIRRIKISDNPIIKISITITLLIAVLFLGAIRSSTWGNSLLLATHLVAMNPDSPRASADLAARYGGLSNNDPNSPLYSLAIAEFERGAKLHGASPLSEQGMILLAAMSGQEQKSAWWNSLDKKLELNLIGPQERSALTSLMMRRYEGIPIDNQALSTAYAIFVRRSGNPVALCLQYADFAHVYLQDEALSARYYVLALEQQPRNPDFAFSLFSQLVSQERTRQANAVYQRIKELDLADSMNRSRSTQAH